MDSRRSLLVLALLFISFLVYQQWQLDKNPPVQQQTTEQQQPPLLMYRQVLLHLPK